MDRAKRRGGGGAAGAKSAPRVRGAPGPMRMAELAARSGVPRETIHFYLREGLLPRPQKGGRTVAFYDEEHLARLRTIRRLREEKYLPLAVIRKLLDAPSAAAERDVDTLAEVLQIDPTLARGDAAAKVPPEVEADALARGLLGPRAAHEPGEVDPAEARVLAIVAEAAALPETARALTLADLEACAGALSALVSREGALFFDAVLATGDVAGTVAALRAGRAAVARFVTAFRDLMLRRIVDELLVSVQRAPDLVARSASVAISDDTARALGAAGRVEASRAALAARGGEGTAERLALLLCAQGATAELASLDPDLVRAGGAETSVLVAWARCETHRSAETVQALERAADAAPGFALGQILAGEASLTRALRHRAPGESLVDEAVPALSRMLRADAEADRRPEARALGLLHRGRVELALPPLLGRGARGAAALERALLVVAGEPFDPLARARIAANAHLWLGRWHLAAKDDARARAALAAAASIDPEGPIAAAVRDELARAR